jgi:diamine N-acetyltransferase
MITVKETRDHHLVATLNEEVQNLHHKLHPAIFKAFNREATTAAIEEFFKDPNCKAFIAWEDDLPVGYMILVVKEAKENAFHYNIRTLYIDQVCVPGQHRNKGAGAKLMQHAELVAKELGIEQLELDHWTANLVAGQRFRKYGYELRKERLAKFIDV